MKRIVTVMVSVFLFAAVEASVAAATTITIPAGDGAVISGVTVGGCDASQYGYSVGAGSVPVAGWGGGCSSTSLSGAQISGASFTRTLQIYMYDATCGATYYSDGSGTANHALVSGNGPFQVAFTDAGGGSCGGAGNDRVPSPGAGNFSATVTILTPPTVTLSAPAATGTNGYFNANDLTNNLGSIAVGVSASDNSGSGVSNISCSENGNPVSLSAVSGVNAATMSGTITLTADGAYAISCIASDNNGETGSSGSANAATYQIDTTAPTLSLPNQPVHLDASSPAGAALSSYDVSASDPDVADAATVTCSPAAPQTFPLGATTVGCTATDRAGNTATGSFEVDVSAAQSIAFSPVGSPGTVGTSAPLSASGGGSGQPIMFSVDAAGTSPSGACTVSQSASGVGTVAYAHLGTCTVAANQAASADGHYTSAQTVHQTVTIQATRPGSARLHLTGIIARAPQRRCESELNQASAAAARPPKCNRGQLSFSGTIDARANGQNITIILTATIAGRARVIHGHARINQGHYRVAVSAPGRRTDFLTGRRRIGGDRWNYTIAYTGSSSLGPARITGHLTLEIEHR